MAILEFPYILKSFELKCYFGNIELFVIKIAYLGY